MLALLVVVVLVAAGCVLWFMREAMQNERLAVRQKLSEAYRGHLALAQARALEQWQHLLARFDSGEPGPSLFARAVQEGWADSAILFDGNGRVVYPQPSRAGAHEGDAAQTELRKLVQGGGKEDAVRFVLEKFAGAQLATATDAQGRLVAANAELLALELLADRRDPRFAQLAARLQARLADYTSPAMPSAQRRFIMRELLGLVPGTVFPTLAGEDLAADYLEAHSAPKPPDTLRTTEQPGVWQAPSPGRHALVLLSTRSLHAALAAPPRDLTLPSGARVTVLAPDEEPDAGGTLLSGALGPSLPGWRVALSFDDRGGFDTAAERRVAVYWWTGSAVLAVMTLFAVFIARGFGRQVQFARIKNDLVATVSHELKTPLTAMRALVDTLLETEKLEETTTREYLHLLAQENLRLSRLIDNFLTFSRLERNKFRFEFVPLHPETVVEEAVAALGERAHAPGCRFETHVAAQLPMVVGDSGALVTAVLNLLDNAWKYSGDEKRIVLRAEANNGHVLFAVEDNGLGLSPRESRRVFEKFYQADQRLSRETGGWGLGLSIVQSIVEAHGGAVHVASQPGQGSTFTIEIPAASTASA
jgi:signal transduction histidine kinase